MTKLYLTQAGIKQLAYTSNGQLRVAVVSLRKATHYATSKGTLVSINYDRGATYLYHRLASRAELKKLKIASFAVYKKVLLQFYPSEVNTRSI